MRFFFLDCNQVCAFMCAQTFEWAKSDGFPEHVGDAGKLPLQRVLHCILCVLRKLQRR